MATTHKRSTYRKHLANPLPDVICIVALTLILMLTGYLHVQMAV